MRSLHIVMPFIRARNKAFYLERFAALGVIWHPLTITSDNVSFATSKGVQPFHNDFSLKPEASIFCYWKLNLFAHSGKGIEDDDYYWILGDDDYFSEHIPFSLSVCNSDVVFISMFRGLHLVPLLEFNSHDITTLYAAPENIKVGKIGLEQYIVKGKVLKNLNFQENLPTADGIIAEHLKVTHRCEYQRDWFVFFNWFQPGRWEKC
jgi:hypothetical protein